MTVPENNESNLLRGRPSIHVERRDAALQLLLSGSWRMTDDRSAATQALAEIRRGAGVQHIVVTGKEIGEWDSALPAFFRAVDALAREAKATVDVRDVPEGARRLWELSRAAPELPAQPVAEQPGALAIIGKRVARGLSDFGASLTFLGELLQAIGAKLRGHASYRRSDFLVALQECGPEALPIVTLISLLVGMILAFLGSVQLKLFGVELFVANAVAIGMLREMGALMTGILLAGRTGAAFAARLGTMQVNEEIDALRTLGFSPMEFLVLPRVLALVVAMPLLAIYAGIVGIIGGAIIGVGMLDLSPAQYYLQTIHSVTPKAIAAGLIKAAVFGVLVALSGCMQGLRCGRSAAAVGEATTSAVVNAIVYIVVADAIISIIYVLIHF